MDCAVLLWLLAIAKGNNPTSLKLSSQNDLIIRKSTHQILMILIGSLEKNGNWVGPTRQGITEQFARYINSHID